MTLRIYNMVRNLRALSRDYSETMRNGPEPETFVQPLLFLGENRR